MLSQILIGLLAIYYGAYQLGDGLPIRLFWWGLVAFGIVYLLEHFYSPVSKHLRRGTAAAE